jgi:alkylation response protein AidB-like acyl-CoA dehydrogenase
MTDPVSTARARAEELKRAVLAFYERDMPAALKSKSARHQVLDKDDYVQWMRLLNDNGWAIGHWPKEHGGQAWSLLERFAFEDQLARLACPWVIPFGVKYVGPVIYSFGTEQQKARFLPGIRNTGEFWAQGYSEPGAGSDLASLRTEAIRDGDAFVVTGQKVWTTYAQWADWIFCLVKTAGAAQAQKAISFLLIDMRSPGVSVKAIPTMDGYHHVNEVWLDKVRVPVENLVGEEGAGWTYAKFLLKNERTAGAIIGTAWHALRRLKSLSTETGGAQARRVGELELRFMALEQAAYQAVEAMMRGTDHGAEASFIKLRGTELYQDIAEALIDVLGPAGIAYDKAALHAAGAPPLGPNDAGGIVKDHLYNRAATIFGGASEIQRNIVAKGVLGL